jgi:hypothetical protein
MVGVCAGWAPGATADRRFLAGAPLVTATPPAPAIASMTPYFHAEPAPAPRSMRRRRILDVARRPDGYEVFEYFRDSHLDADLREGALHEYEVHARAAADAGGTVKQRLAGTRSCTHLNDTLRFLRYVPALAELGKNEENR